MERSAAMIEGAGVVIEVLREVLKARELRISFCEGDEAEISNISKG